jgi:tRNA pseudouridine55 synthase
VAPPAGARPGFVVVDKPSGLTSHDVVSRARRLAGTRRVGHAGTLDPMATGVLLLGVERATKLLGHLALTDKAYEATIRLGQSTVTDDAEGSVTSTAPVDGVTERALAAAVVPLTGAISQVPSRVSAIKVDGKRSYQRVREGEDVRLTARPVTVSRFDVVQARPARTSDGGAVLDVDVVVDCSTGTYVRALARDLGEALGVGGHLTRLRRTRVGAFGLDRARTLEQLEEAWEVLSVEDVVSSLYPRRDVDEDVAPAVRNGGRLELLDERGPVAVFSPDGRALAVMEPRDGALRPLVILHPA